MCFVTSPAPAAAGHEIAPCRVRTGNWTVALPGAVVGDCWVLMGTGAVDSFEDTGHVLFWHCVRGVEAGQLCFTLRDAGRLRIETTAAPERAIDPERYRTLTRGALECARQQLDHARAVAGVPGNLRMELLAPGERRRVYRASFSDSPLLDWEIDRCDRCDRWAMLSCNGAAHAHRLLLHPCECP